MMLERLNELKIKAALIALRSINAIYDMMTYVLSSFEIYFAYIQIIYFVRSPMHGDNNDDPDHFGA